MSDTTLLRDRTRRAFLQLASTGAVGFSSMSGWLDVLAAQAAAGKRKYKSCILLWMDGGPPQTDMFDMKPDSPGKGVLKPIQTSVTDVHICEGLPKFAKLMKHATLVRSMSTGEAEHQRARYHLHTGVKQSPALKYPSIGATVSEVANDPDFPLPHYVFVGGGFTNGLSSGFLGTQHEPLIIRNPEKGVENLKAPVDARQMDEQVNVLQKLEEGFARNFEASAGEAHAKTVQRALRMMRAEQVKAFDLSLEPAAVRKAYNDYSGKHPFGDGCLLARRLIEVGVPFVEVGWGGAPGGDTGWDLHGDCNTKLKAKLPILDGAMSALITDLKERGMLDSTLVVWMGEFGRTPDLQGAGRDHFAKAWTTMFMGGGIKAGQVVGKTDKTGHQVVERPVSAADFLATICQVLGIDYTKHHSVRPNKRPIHLVDKDAKPIAELI